MDSVGYIYIFLHLYTYIKIIIKDKEGIKLRGGKGNIWESLEGGKGRGVSKC